MKKIMIKFLLRPVVLRMLKEIQAYVARTKTKKDDKAFQWLLEVLVAIEWITRDDQREILSGN